MWVSPMSRILEKGIVGLINFPRYAHPKIISILLPILSIRRSSTWLSCSPNLTHWDKSPKRDILWLRLSLSLCISDNLTYSPRPKRRQGRLRGWHDLGFDLISLLRSGPLSLSICFTALNLEFLWQWHWECDIKNCHHYNFPGHFQCLLSAMLTASERGLPA